MDLKLTGKVAVVTGGSQGIGKAIARALAGEGCAVAIIARHKETLDAAAGEIKAATGARISAVVADMTKTEQVNRAIEGIVAEFGRIDILVNNAGAAPGGVLETLSDEDWESGLQLKFLGYVRATRAVIPYMKKQKSGRVVNLIGNDGIKHSYWEIVPGAANAAGQNLTLSLAGQYGRFNISFVAVNPGPVRTERWDGLIKAMARDMKITTDQANARAAASIPLGRIAEVEEVADLVTYLASERAHYVNGTMIEVDGGQQKPLMDAMRDKA